MTQGLNTEETTDLLIGDLNAPEQRKRAFYAAFKANEARFDGQVFVGVSSTGIYCRPVCRVHMPKYENCTFFRTAAEAEAAGYRPCMRCRPELAPGAANVDAQKSLARRAAALLRERCSTGESVEALAAKLGYTDRHLRRAFEQEFGVTPVQYLQTCRLLLAKTLLTDTHIPVSQVASAAGFGSVRRFNALFKERYRLTPTQLRTHGLPKRAHGGAAAAVSSGKGRSMRLEPGEGRRQVDQQELSRNERRTTRQEPGTEECRGTRRGLDAKGGCDAQLGIAFYLAYRPPYEFDRLLGFFRARQLEGVEAVDEHSYTRTVRITELAGWVRVENDAARNRLAVRMSESLLPVISQVAERIRRQFDTDCDPQAVLEGIRSLDDAVPGAAVSGTRVPGAFDAFETAVRAVLGQQVSVQAANKLAARIAEAYGTPVEFGMPGIARLFPAPEDFLALDPIEDALGQLGVIRSRSRTIRELARLIVEGELDLSPAASVSDQMERLLAIPGIGPWSANYIAMRTLGYTDAFLETDAGVKHALPDLSPKERLALAEQWRPWRAYANLCLWNSLG